MVYNCRDDTRLGGRELIGASTDAYKMAPRTLALLILAALAATVFIGCAAGSGGSSRPQAKQQASETTGSSGQEAEGTDPSGQVAAKRLGHPALGSADAPVVLTEYSDYQ